MASAQVVSPKVTTDQSVDTSTLQTVVNDVCRLAGAKTQQEKAIALFYYGRKMMFPYPNRTDGVAVHDALHLLNTYGYSFCSQQAMLTTTLWKVAGIQCEVLAVPGHVTMQAEYDGDKHWFDLLIGAFVYERDGKTIASIQDIAKDPTLLSKAAEEGRAPEAFVPGRIVLKGDAARFCKHNPKYIRECADYADDVDYMAKTAKLAKQPGWAKNIPTKSRYKPQITLRRGESVEFLWDFIPGNANCNTLTDKQPARNYWVRESDLPPHHIYGAEAEKRDTINYKYWKAYTKTIQGVSTGRYAANGRHAYWPDLAKKPLKGDFESNTFTWAKPADGSPALRVAQAGEVSELICTLKTPHVYTSGKLILDLYRAKADDVSRVLMYFNRWDNKTRRMVQGWHEVWNAAKAKTGVGKVRAEIDLVEQTRNLRELKIKIECKTSGDPAKAGVGGLKMESIFQHNMFARPHLVAGDNKVTVKVGNAQALETEDFTVTYAWKEGDADRTNVRQVTESPMSYKIKVGGKELPRMLRLKMAVSR